VTSTETITTLNVGDTVPIGTVLANLIIMGIVTDINNPNMFSATLQAFQSNAVLTVPVLQGVKGNPGQPTFPLQFQNSILASPADLPQTLNNTTDLGKFWVFAVLDNNGNVIATQMEVWFGTTLGFQSFPVGSPGPPGPFPVITPNIVVQEPGNGLGPNGVSSWIAVTGTVSNPTFTFNIAAPQGIAGPAAQLSTCPDINFTTVVPSPGDVLTCTSQIVPGAPTSLTAQPLSTGGEFAAGQYFWAITAILTNGAETMASNEVEVLLAGATSSVVLNWVAPPGQGAIGYKIYRGTSATAISVLVTTIEGGTTTTFTDTGAAGAPGSPPSIGVTAGRSIWGPQPFNQPAPLLFTVPQSAFTSQSGVGASQQPVATFAMPQQPFPWVPFVFGQMNIFGVNISTSPLLIGAEVLLGNAASGQLIASGVGNSLGAVDIIPQASNANNTSGAITPTNAVGQVPANHNGTQGTLYVNLISQGMAGVYDFNAAGAQLAVLVVPIVNSAQAGAS
jgi:hypothetical protein